MVDLLLERGFDEVSLLASARSAGSEVRGMRVEEATPESFGAFDVCFFSVGSTASRELVPHALRGGALCIDKSEAFRLEPGVPLVVPEVNGGRALEHDGVVPDIMAVGKGLAGGYIPLAATILRKEVGDTILSGQGAIMTGHTYSGHTAACAAGLAVQRIIERESLVDRVRSRGETLRHELERALARFDEVGDVRGRGYLIGIEFVRDRATREPFPAERALSQSIGRSAFEDGLIIYPCAGNVGGVSGDTVIVAPPFNASEGELSELLEKLAGAIGRTLAAG